MMSPMKKPDTKDSKKVARGADASVPYDPAQIEAKWQKKWASSKVYASKDPGTSATDAQKKYYVLDMFPYPSGEGLHVGHPKGYIATDVISRMRRMQGMNVLHPMGFDAFGLPAENYALKTKTHPEAAVKKNIAYFKSQLEKIGLDYDWSREVNTTDPEYYRWTQWIFLQLYKKGLAYESFEPINWCPSCKTGLANEDLIDGRCERCGTPVEKKPMRQWVLKITKYADRLLRDLDLEVLPNGDLFETHSNGEYGLIHMNTEVPGKIRPDRPFVERNAICAFVEHWEGNSFLALKWKKVDWMTAVTGGIEPGESAEAAAQREIYEETGFKDLVLIKQAPDLAHSTFFHVPKDENRIGHFNCLHFKLKSNARDAVVKDEQVKHEIVWLPKDRYRDTMTAEGSRLAWDLIMYGEPKHERKQLLDWPEAIKESQRNWIGRSEGAEIDFRIELDKDKPRFVLIHGYKGSPDMDFFPWLKTELEKRGHEVQVPQLPNSNAPEETEQVQYVLKNCKIDENTVVIAHSLGCVIALKAIMRLNKPISGLLLIASAMDPSFDKRPPRSYDVNRFSWDFDFEQIKRHAQGKIAVLADSKEPFRAPYLKHLAHELHASLTEVDATQKHFNGKIEPAVLDCCTPKVTVFTTRPDTLYGVTYLTLAPEHPWVNELMDRLENRTEVEAYVARARNESAIERTDATKDKTGVELKGIHAINPVNGDKVPVWISDYVLADYGTGAVMAVPAHDDRDFAFAQKFKLPVKQVVIPEFGTIRPNEEFRDGACTVAFDPVAQRYAVTVDDKGFYRLCGGGIDAGESYEQCARREMEEESGLYDAKSMELIGEVRAHYHNILKKVNRVAHSNCYVAVLNSPKTRDHKLESHETGFKLAWVRPEEAITMWDSLPERGADHYIWILEQAVGLLIEKGIDTASDPKRFPRAAILGSGALTDSGPFNGKQSDAVMKEITAAAEGRWVAKYKLRDWVFSRQRYWGEPIPLIHCETCGVVPVPEKDLPVKLPKVTSYEPTGTGESPLAAIDEWVYVECPNCKPDKNKPKYFILDFDGVLGDTWEARIQAKLQTGMVKSREESIAASVANFEKRPHHARDSGISAEELRKEVEREQVIGAEVFKIRPPLFDGFIREVKKFKGTKLAVVSSGSGIYVKGLLEKAGLPFTHIQAFEDHHSKEEKIERICNDWKVSVKEIYYFTDTKSDVYELENLVDRQKLVGCAWGYQGFDKLKEALPERQILRDFKDIHRFFKTAGMARRETNTMPQWAGSCWYYLRYEDPKNKKSLVDPKKEKYWSPVDLYVGGAEHATRHLIYARFWHKFLYDIGAVSTIEPFKKLQSVGLIMGEDGRKMGKRYGNVVNPDDVIATYGADTLRLYEMFMGPFDQEIAWSTESMVGPRRFIERAWNLRDLVSDCAKPQLEQTHNRLIHKTIKKVTEDIQSLRFNTAISSLMICLNEFQTDGAINKGIYEAYLKLLAPFAPHVAEELWMSLGNKKSIHISPWPTYDPTLIEEDEATIIVQVNGKVRASFKAPVNSTRESLESAAKLLPDAQKWLNGKEIRKTIVVPDRLVNFVV